MPFGVPGYLALLWLHLLLLFIQSVKENQVTQYWRRKRGLHNRPPQGEVRKSPSMFFFPSSSWHIKPVVGANLGKELYRNEAFQLPLENKTRKGLPKHHSLGKLLSALKRVSFPVASKMTKVSTEIIPLPPPVFFCTTKNKHFFKKNNETGLHGMSHSSAQNHFCQD